MLRGLSFQPQRGVDMPAQGNVLGGHAISKSKALKRRRSRWSLALG